MRRFLPAALIVFLVFLSCTDGRRPEPKLIVAKSADSADDASPAGEQDRIRPASARPRIVIDPADKVLSVLEANLDQDSDVEQVIAVKRMEPVDSPVRVVVADSNSAKGRYYYQSCEESTASTSSRVFSMSLKDLVGDHGTEIIVRGMNAQGRLTLDVLKRAAPAAGHDLTYKTVCSVAGDDIAIVESERSAQYSSGQKNGQSFPIAVSRHDPASPDATDLIRVMYTWSFAEGRFTAGAEEKLPGEKVAQKQLETLFDATDTESFSAFLDGSWVELSEPSKPGFPPRVLQLISFQPGHSLISRYIGDTMEIYVWSGANRLLYDRMMVTIEDDTFHTVARYIMIRAVSMDSIEVSIQEADLADTTTAVLSRVNDRISRQYLEEPAPSVTMTASGLAGTYQNESGLRIGFSGSAVIWTEAAAEKRGYFVTYSIAGVSAVSFRFLDAAGTPFQTVSYLMQPGERKEMGKTITTLTLSPIRLTVGGYEEEAADPLVLDRIADQPQG